MLELATYFMGRSSRDLEGLGSDYDDLMLGPESWYVVGTDPGIALIRMPRTLAFAELDERGAAHPDAVLFRLDRGYAEWRLASEPGWKDMNADQARRLACPLTVGDGWSREELRRWVVGNDGEDPDARFRQAKTRLNAAFQELTGRPGVKLFDPKSPGPVPRIANGVILFGAVDSRPGLRPR
jgi:hypothetical protein